MMFVFVCIDSLIGELASPQVSAAQASAALPQTPPRQSLPPADNPSYSDWRSFAASGTKPVRLQNLLVKADDDEEGEGEELGGREEEIEDELAEKEAEKNDKPTQSDEEFVAEEEQDDVGKHVHRRKDRKREEEEIDDDMESTRRQIELLKLQEKLARQKKQKAMRSSK